MNLTVSFEDLRFTYRGGKKPALMDICGGIQTPHFVVIMGHGGAGKSTLCYCFNGLVPNFFRGDYKGRLLVKGREVAKHSVSEMSRTVGLVFQDFEAQLFSTTVELEMAFGPENHCLSRSEIERRIGKYLTFIGLEKFRYREPVSLSGGQKQRLAIGSVLTLEPDVLVMDEPTTDLDPEGRKEVLSLAEKFRKENRILLIVDHEPEIALLADQVWLMREGEVVAQGNPEAILLDLPRLRTCGIRPLPTLELAQQMGWPERPLTLELTLQLIKKYHPALPKQFRSPPPSSLSPTQPILAAEELKYFYSHPPIEALKGVDLSIGAGEFVAILGQNGSGKTTLAKHFNGLLKPSAGCMRVHGKSTVNYSHRELARQVGYVFQNPDHQIFAKTVREEVGFGLKALGENPLTIENRIAEALQTVGLLGYEEKNPFALTKGERQRVAVASVLATRPEVILLDEPTTGLDHFHQKNMMEMLKDLNRRGHTIIIITHSMGVAAEYADRIIVMKEGRVLIDGPTRSVFADENRLTEVSLAPPLIVQLSNRLGTEALTVDQLVKELKSQGQG
mgnify:CR=1 FL=1